MTSELLGWQFDTTEMIFHTDCRIFCIVINTLIGTALYSKDESV